METPASHPVKDCSVLSGAPKTPSALQSHAQVCSTPFSLLIDHFHCLKTIFLLLWYFSSRLVKSFFFYRSIPSSTIFLSFSVFLVYFNTFWIDTDFKLPVCRFLKIFPKLCLHSVLSSYFYYEYWVQISLNVLSVGLWYNIVSIMFKRKYFHCSISFIIVL